MLWPCSLLTVPRSAVIFAWLIIFEVLKLWSFGCSGLTWTLNILTTPFSLLALCLLDNCQVVVNGSKAYYGLGSCPQYFISTKYTAERHFRGPMRRRRMGLTPGQLLLQTTQIAWIEPSQRSESVEMFEFGLTEKRKDKGTTKKMLVVVERTAHLSQQQHKQAQHSPVSQHSARQHEQQGSEKGSDVAARDSA